MKRIAVAVVAVALILANVPARAESGGFDDPQNDFTSGSSPFDVRRVSHTDTVDTVTYTVESYGDFDIGHVSFKWEIECNPGPSGDDVAVVGVASNRPGVAPTVHVDKSGVGKVADGSASKSGSAVLVTYPRSALSAAGCTTDTTTYELFANYNAPNSVDRIPNDGVSRVSHTLGGTSTTPAPTTTLAPTTTAPPETTIAPATTEPATTIADTPETTVAADEDDDSNALPLIVAIIIVIVLIAAVVAALSRRRRDEPPQ